MKSSDLFIVKIDKPDEPVRKRYVRYMLSPICKSIVRSELDQLGIRYAMEPYGGIEFVGEIPEDVIDTISQKLRLSGMELLDPFESKLVDRIIDTIIEVVHCFDELPKLTFKEIITQNLGDANGSVHKIFSEIVGMSVIQFIVIQKIERIKELLLYHDYPLSKIASLMKYKSEAHLIAQFKKSTGLTPFYFTDIKQARLNLSSNNTDQSRTA